MNRVNRPISQCKAEVPHAYFDDEATDGDGDVPLFAASVADGTRRRRGREERRYEVFSLATGTLIQRSWATKEEAVALLRELAGRVLAHAGSRVDVSGESVQVVELDDGALLLWTEVGADARDSQGGAE